MRLGSLLIAIPLAVWISLVAASAQQPAPTPPQQEEVPTFSADGTTISEPAPLPPESEEKKTTEEGELTDEEREDEAGEEGTAKDAKKGPTAEELAWRTRLAAAERALQEAEKAAIEAELKVTELRNQGTARGSDTRFAAELEAQGNVVKRAQERVTAAKIALEAIRAQGAAKKFTASPTKAETAGQKPANPKANLRGQFSEAKRKLDDVNRRISLYQSRVSDLNLRLTVNSGSGDNYAQAGIQSDLDKAQEELSKAKAEQPAAQAGFERARRAATSAGVPVRDLQ